MREKIRAQRAKKKRGEAAEWENPGGAGFILG